MHTYPGALDLILRSPAGVTFLADDIDLADWLVLAFLADVLMLLGRLS